MLFAHGSLFCCARRSAPCCRASPTSNEVFESVWLTVLSFEALLFTIAIAFILLAMAKERTELSPQDRRAGRSADRHRQPPRVPAGRRGATASARPTIRARPRVMLLDLDNFKSINDRFGHAVGDRVLQIFAEAAQPRTAPRRSVGRLGGEEFAAVLVRRRPRSGAGGGRAGPRRLRRGAAARSMAGRSCAHREHRHGDQPGQRPATCPALLAQADQALYCAKERGRNRVEVASLELILDRADKSAAQLMAAVGAKSAARSTAKSAA